MSETLSNKLNLMTIQINDIYREFENSKVELTAEVKSYLDNGQIIPDELLYRLIETRISSTNSDIQIISYPRTKEQFLSLNELLKANSFTIDQIWFLKINDIQQLVSYKLKEESENPYAIKFGFNSDAFIKRYSNSLQEFKELKKVIADKSLISEINIDYPIGKQKNKIEKSIEEYITKKVLNG